MIGLDRFVSVVFLMVLCSMIHLPCTEANVFSLGGSIGGDIQPLGTKQMQYAHLDLFGAAGIKVYGQGWVSWNTIEPTPPFEGIHNYNWSTLDKDIQEIEAVGGRLQPNLMADAPWAIETTQAWSSPPKDDIICAQDNPNMGMSCWEAWRDFVSAVVERYDNDGFNDMDGLQRAHLYWQIGSEYENVGQWNTADGNQRAEKYVELLKVAYEAAEQANLDAKIISFSFNFGDVFDDNPSVEEFNELNQLPITAKRDFAVQVWEQAKDYFDMVGANVNYHYNGIPARVRWIRSYVDKPIWFHHVATAHLLDRRFVQPPLYDEFFYPYRTETEIGEILVSRDHSEHVTIKRWWEKEKAEYAIKKAIITASQGVTGAGFLAMFDTMGSDDFWGTIAEMALDIGAGILEGGFDVEPSGTPKPVYYTIKLFNQKVGNASSVADLSPLPEGADPSYWTWKIKFTKDDQETLVLWSERQERTVDLSSHFSTPNVKVTHIVSELDENNQPIYPDDEIVSANSVPIDETPIFVDEFPSVPSEHVFGCELVPDATTVSRGENTGIWIGVTNNTDEVQAFGFATYVTEPNGERYPPSGYLIGPIRVSLNPYESKSAHRLFPIPGNTPLGTYTYHGVVGTPGAGFYHEYQFDFVVEP